MPSYCLTFDDPTKQDMETLGQPGNSAVACLAGMHENLISSVALRERKGKREKGWGREKGK